MNDQLRQLAEELAKAGIHPTKASQALKQQMLMAAIQQAGSVRGGMRQLGVSAATTYRLISRKRVEL